MKTSGVKKFGLIALGLLFAAAPLQARADGFFDIGGIAGKVVAKVFLFIGYLVSLIATVFIQLNAWAIEVFIQLNEQIVQAPAVQIGYQITLAITNLGFVLAIIFIAIATILRMQSYSIKKTLTRLVIAALLVNFSLIIIQIPLKISNDLTRYFVNSSQSNLGLAGSIVDAFNPQQLIAAGGTDANADLGTAASLTGTIGDVVAPIVRLVFTMLALVMVVIVLMTVAGLFLVRYIYIGFLIILMPFVWLLWIFPSTERYWKMWWEKFTGWILFAPAIMLFVFLVVKTGDAIQAGNYTFATPTYVSPSQNNLIAGVSGAFGTLVTSVVGPVLNSLVLCGILIGGLLAAQKLGYAAAGGAYNTAQGLVTGLGNRVAKRTREFGGRQASRALNSERGKNLSEGLSRLQSRMQASRLGRWTGAAAVAGMASQGVTAARTQVGEKRIERATKDIAKVPLDNLLQNYWSYAPEERLAIQEMALKKGKAASIPGLERELENKSFYEQAGKGKLYGEVERATGMTAEKKKAGAQIAQEVDKAYVPGSRKHEEALGAVARGETPESLKDNKVVSEAQRIVKEENARLAKEMGESDYKNLAEAKGVFKDYDEKKPYMGMGPSEFAVFQQTTLNMIATQHPGIAARAFPKMNMGDFEQARKNLVSAAFDPKTMIATGDIPKNTDEGFEEIRKNLQSAGINPNTMITLKEAAKSGLLDENQRPIETEAVQKSFQDIMNGGVREEILRAFEELGKKNSNLKTIQKSIEDIFEDRIPEEMDRAFEALGKKNPNLKKALSHSASTRLLGGVAEEKTTEPAPAEEKKG